MTVLWINLVIVLAFSLFARYYAPAISTSIPLPPFKINWLFSLGALSSLILISGLRNNIGDTYFYKHAYEVNNFDWGKMEEQANIGFWLFQKALKNYSEDPQILIFTAALITNVLIIIVFSRYSRMFELSTYV